MVEDWLALFSGGKDSSLALHRALQRGFEVDTLVTVHPTEDSFMYHHPATRLTELAAESIGIQLLELELNTEPQRDYVYPKTDSSVQADRELQPLEAALSELVSSNETITGLIVGAIASEYQFTHIRDMCNRLGIEVFAPLWQENPQRIARELINEGFEIQFIHVAADGLDETWLGRYYDEEALGDLIELNHTHGVHILGEGGEFETLVTDGPHMARPILYEYETSWDDTRGGVRIRNARLADDTMSSRSR